MVKSEKFLAENDILIAPELAFGLSCIVSATGVSAGSDGKKIIKAGTPLYASADVLTKRSTELSVTSGGTCYGIARHDIDVTNLTKANATLLIAGYVNIDMLDATVVSALESVKATLTSIKFIKGDA